MAARNLGSLTVDLLLKIGGFKQGMDQAARETERAKTRISKSVQGISSTIGGIGKAFAAIGVGFSTVAIVRGLTSSASAAIKFGEEMQLASAKSGIAASTLSELSIIAKDNEVSFDALATAIKKMQVNVSEAASGSKAQVETFKALGIEIEHFKQLAPEKQFEVLAEQINRFKDPADRARAAVELFGKAGADLLPLFTQGAEGIRKAREEAGKLTEDQIKDLAAADAALDKLSNSWDSFARTLTARVSPALTDIFNKMADGLSDSRESALRRQIALLKEFEGRGGLFIGAGKDIGNGLLSAAEVAAKTAELERKLRALSGGLPPGGRDRSGSAPPGFGEAPAVGGGGGSGKILTRSQLAGLSEVAITVREITTSATEQLYAEMNAATETAMERQLGEWARFDEQVAELVKANVITASEGAARIAENNAGILEPIEVNAERIVLKVEETTNKLSEFAKEAAANMQDAFADFLFDPFKDGLSGMITGFADTLRRMAANAVAANIFESLGIGKLLSGGVGGLASSFAGLFADGGTIQSGKWGIVGENGPELAFAGSGGTQITPIGMKSMNGNGVKTTNNYINVPISAPTGSVSRSTVLQTSAAVARGIRMADVRDN